MDHLLLHCFIFNIVFTITSAGGIVRGPCPLACKCDLERGVVDCPYGYWNELPKIPEGTKQVRIKGGTFLTIQGPSSCQNYSNVTHLELVDHVITFIDALECLPKLQTLTIMGNQLSIKSNYIFHHVHDLHNITIVVYKLYSPFKFNSALCTIETLKMLTLIVTENGYDNDPLNCLGYLKHLSHVELTGLALPPNKTHRLQALQNVSDSITYSWSLIESLQDDTFFGFNVKVLDLSFNKIKYIQRNTFTHLPNLIKLKLAGNPISEIQEWLGNLNSLIEIDLRLQASYTSVLLETCLEGKMLEASNTNLAHILSGSCDLPYSKLNVEKNTFVKLQKLEILYLGYNNIVQNNITNLLYDIAHCPLKVLSLSGIPLHILNSTFQAFYQNQLMKLYLQKCRITQIMARTFEHFQDLQELELSHNTITILQKNAFQGLTSLKTLSLHHNHIQFFIGLYFGLSSPLRILELNNNLLISVWLSNISTLIKADFSYNTRLVSVKLINPTHFISLRSLQMSAISFSVFLQASNVILSPLTVLNLSNNAIGLLHWKEQKQIWSNASQLRSLDISYCKITALVPRLFSSLGHLQILTLSSNQIASIHQSALEGVSNLTELYLQNNVIRYVNFDTFVFTPYLRLLSLANNPLVCTCDVLWISQAVKTPALVYIHNQDETHCIDSLVVKNIKELNMTLSDCESHWSAILKLIGIGSASILALVFLYIAWYYQWHIRYTLFLARAGRGRFQEMCDDHEYLYDAFVAYSIEDLPWVKQQMLPNVDVDYFGLGGFKLCLHHRDWLVGVDITENIVKSIAESRRTILVLSKDFAASYWCRFELAMAHMKLDVEGGNKSRLMVILLNDIPPKLLNPRLVHILGTKTYIAWPQDPNEHQLFWKTIRKSLRKELLYTTKE